MSGVYTVSFDSVTVSAVQDLIAVVANSSRPLFILGFSISVAGGAADAGDAQEELLPIRVRSGQTTAGSGGTAPTPVAVDTSNTAANFTARANDTTQASAGTIVTHWTGALNNRVGIDVVFPEGQQILLVGGRRATLELTAAPADALTVSGTMTLQEVG